MKKGLLALISAVILLVAPACCWRRSSCSPCPKPCAPVCAPKNNDCVVTDCETYIEPVKAERVVTIETTKRKRCGVPRVEACCDNFNGDEYGSRPVKKARMSME
jgi:hypothetical protein